MYYTVITDGTIIHCFFILEFIIIKLVSLAGTLLSAASKFRLLPKPSMTVDKLPVEIYVILGNCPHLGCSV